MIKTIHGIQIEGISCCVPDTKLNNEDFKENKNRARAIKAIGIE